MPSNKKPRKPHRPRPIIADPMAYVKESMTPIALHESYLIDLKIRNSLAMSTLLRGGAKKSDMDMLIAMSNIAEALCALGFGKAHKALAKEGERTIKRIILRAVKILRFTPTGPEIVALNALMELHDAQMDAITVGDMERALAYAKEKLRKKAAEKLPPIPAELWDDYVENNT